MPGLLGHLGGDDLKMGGERAGGSSRAVIGVRVGLHVASSYDRCAVMHGVRL